MTASVLTLVRDRTAALANLVRGLGRSGVAAGELVVARMGGEDPTPVLEDSTVPWTLVEVSTDRHALPLAAARNDAARTASGEALVFLDVDCIPGTALVGAYVEALQAGDGLLMGPVHYLPPGAAEGAWEEADLARAGREHPSRAVPVGGDVLPTPDYHLFWSLSFAVRRGTFLERIGGFDEGFEGYGGEDTDLAFSARAAGVPLAWVPRAVAYHQDHEHYDPPLHRLDDIVANASRFHEKWGTWPMEGWLRAFAASGYLERDDGRLVVRRMPTEVELHAARRRVYPGS